MQNILHWIAVALAFLVVIGGMRMSVRGLSQKPSDPSTRVRFDWQNWWRP
jgi:cytochrome b subunit of formate dehydrogenase